MPAARYDRFGLTSNPFRDLSSESLEDVEIFHVRLQVDQVLRGVEEDVLDKENRAVVAIVGPLGAGKTQRLRLAAAEGKERGAFVVYLDVPSRAALALHAITEEIQKALKAGGFARTFSAPPSLRELTQVANPKGPDFDAARAGKAIAQTLNERAPAFLLLNDLHNLAPANEVSSIARMLQAISDSIRPGVLVMLTAYPNFLASVVQAFPAFGSRVNRTLDLPTLSNDEAGLLLAKKLLAKRLVEEIDPLYPFDKEAVAVLNHSVGGNARRLLEAADRVLEYATDLRSYRVDGTIARAGLEATARTRPAAPSSPDVATEVRSKDATGSRAAAGATAPLRPAATKDP